MRLRLTAGGRSRRLLLACFACLIPLAAFAEHYDDPSGVWLTGDGDGLIEIAPCGEGFCGRIVGMSEPLGRDGEPRRDHAGRPQCGLTILRSTGRSEDGVWSGRIDDPDTGKEWHCEFWRAADGLHLRGYVLLSLLGETQVWKAFAGQVSADCALQR